MDVYEKLSDPLALVEVGRDADEPAANRARHTTAPTRAILPLPFRCPPMRLLISVLLLTLCTATLAARPGVPVSPEAPWAVPVAADTIRTAVTAGEAVVMALPEARGAQYRVVSAPALSWLVDRSFFWQTLPSERGLRLVVLERLGSADTLVLAIEVVGE